MHFADALLNEVMPRVEKEFNVAKDRDHRAIAGLSMGGAEATFVGLNHLDKFAYIGSFSGAYVMWPGANGVRPAAVRLVQAGAAGCGTWQLRSRRFRWRTRRQRRRTGDTAPRDHR